MGAAASMDRAAAEAAAGARFDAPAFAALAGDGGCVRVVVLKIPAGRKTGLSFSKAGLVSRVNPGGLADKRKVAVGWRCFDVAGKAVGAAGEINGALAAARETNKPFDIVFVAPPCDAGRAAAKPSKPSKPGKPGEPPTVDAAAVEAEDAAAAERKTEAAAAAAAAALEAEAPRAAAAAAAAVEAATAAEAVRRKALGNGSVVVKYERYAEEFPIVDGSTTAAAIDDEYCLSYVMPKCKIFLSPCSPVERTEYLEKGVDAFFYVDEDPKQTYRNLEAGTTYYAYIKENDDEFKRYQRKTRKVFAAEVKAEKVESEYAKEGLPETCSCIYGNPCVDEYGCRNWSYRFAIAKKNGWKEAF